MKFKRLEHEAHIRGIFPARERARRGREEANQPRARTHTRTRTRTYTPVPSSRWFFSCALVRCTSTRLSRHPSVSTGESAVFVAIRACAINKSSPRTHWSVRSCVRRCVHPRRIVSSLRPSFLRSRFMRLRQVLRGCAAAVPLSRPSGDESLKVTSCARVRRLARFSSAEAADPPTNARPHKDLAETFAFA